SAAEPAECAFMQVRNREIGFAGHRFGASQQQDRKGPGKILDKFHKRTCLLGPRCFALSRSVCYDVIVKNFTMFNAAKRYKGCGESCTIDAMELFQSEVNGHSVLRAMPLLLGV